MGGADYQPNFDIDSLIDDLTNQLFDQATQESVSDGFELARQELSRMLVEDSIAQDMAKKVATADYAGDKGQNVGEGTAFESDGTDNDGQDGDYQYQESKIGTAVEAHRESIDRGGPRKGYCCAPTLQGRRPWVRQLCNGRLRCSGIRL